MMRPIRGDILMHIKNDLLNLQLLQQQRVSLKIMNTATERISSGSRINRVSDDIGTSSMSVRLESLSRANKQGLYNVQDAIDLLNVMDTGASSIKDMVQHLRDLVVKNQNTSLSATEKSALQLEFKQTINNIEDIAKTTTFNNKTILNNQSLQLNGVNNYVNLGSSYRNLASSNHTLETTFTVDKIPTTERAFIYGFEGKHHAIELNPDGSLMLQTWLVDSSGTATSNTIQTEAGFIKEGETYQATGVIDANNKTIHFYVNGKEVGTPIDIGSRSLFDYTSSYWGNLRVGIGNDPGGDFDYPFQGTVSSGKLYNSALSSAEVTSSYKGRLSQTGVVSQWLASDGIYNKEGTIMNGASLVNDKFTIRSGASYANRTKIELTNLSAKALNLYSLSIDDSSALQTIDSALNSVLSEKSKIGGAINTMTYRQQQIYSSYTASSQAIENSYSANTAQESSILSKEQLRLQSTLTMLQKYNAYKMSAVKLLEQ